MIKTGALAHTLKLIFFGPFATNLANGVPNSLVLSTVVTVDVKFKVGGQGLIRINGEQDVYLDFRTKNRGIAG